MPYALGLPALELQERDGTRRQVGYQAIEAVDELQRSQQPDEHDKVSTVSGFDTLECALRYACAFGELGLSQIGVDAATLEALAQFSQERTVGHLSGESHNSSFKGT
jgi:hypothetical protein